MRSSDPYARFISLAAWLQTIAGNDPIYLPTRKLAPLLGVTPMTVSRWRQFGEKDGFIEKVRDHDFPARRATEFRFGRPLPTIND